MRLAIGAGWEGVSAHTPVTPQVRSQDSKTGAQGPLLDPGHCCPPHGPSRMSSPDSNPSCTIWPVGPPPRECSSRLPRGRGARLGPRPPPQGFHQLISPGATCLLFPAVLEEPDAKLWAHQAERAFQNLGCWPTRPPEAPPPKPKPRRQPSSPGGSHSGTAAQGGLPAPPLPRLPPTTEQRRSGPHLCYQWPSYGWGRALLTRGLSPPIVSST